MMVKRKLGICYCRNMRRATSAITDIYDEILKPSGLRVNQFAILINLSRLDECSVSELADVLSLERTSLVRALKPLYDKKLIEDVSAPAAIMVVYVSR